MTLWLFRSGLLDGEGPTLVGLIHLWKEFLGLHATQWTQMNISLGPRSPLCAVCLSESPRYLCTRCECPGAATPVMQMLLSSFAVFAAALSAVRSLSLRPA